MSRIKTREEIITSMCLTHSHNYGLMNEKEREGLRITMGQILDNDIVPQMVLRETSSSFLKIEEFVNGLKIIVLRYDEANGKYPESQFEGLEIFGFALGYLGLDQSAMNEFVEKNKEVYGS